MNIIKIEKIGYGGKGIGRLEGKVCFVENALPGEAVEITILQDKKNFIEARAVKIDNPSPARETPPCPHYGSCGGCQYQHMSYAEETRWKEIQIKESLQKQLSLPDEFFLPIVPSTSPYGYRNHLTLHRASQGWGFVNEDNESKFAIQSCLIAKKEINDWLAIDNRPPTTDHRPFDHAQDKPTTDDKRLKENSQEIPASAGMTAARQTEGQRLSTIDHRQERITIRVGAAGKITTSAEDAFFNITIGNVRFRTHSRCFFQNNLEMTLKIAEQVHKRYESLKPEHFWDLYAGVGTFTMLVHPSRAQTLCVENHPEAPDALQMNLNNAGLAAEISPEPVEDCIEDILEEPRLGKVLALIDPPRTGLDPIVSRARAAGKGPDCLMYISCHMGALGRDLRILTERAYKIESVQAFDMFPRTKHIETLVILTKR